MIVAILLAVHVLIFGVLGYVLFSGFNFKDCKRKENTNMECSTACSEPDCCSDYFSTLHSSLLQCAWHASGVRHSGCIAASQ
jgi:hypothetical protein